MLDFVRPRVLEDVASSGLQFWISELFNIQSDLGEKEICIIFGNSRLVASQS